MTLPVLADSVLDRLADPDFWFQAAGWVGQGFFFVRFLIQWLASERAKRIVVPVVFWWLSCLGGVLALVYAMWKHDTVFIAGAAVPLFIYPRNLWLLRTGRRLDRGLLVPVALGLLVFAAMGLVLDLEKRFLELPPFWQVVGGVGQAFWVSRFPLQWWISERLGRSTLPPAFFGVSLVGAVLLLGYALYTGDAVFIAGQILTPFLNARSLWIALRPASAETAPDGAG